MLLAGISIPTSGFLMQEYFQNPLAGPDILGITRMSFFAKLFGLNNKPVESPTEIAALSFLEIMEKRRSIYAIGRNLSQSPAEIEQLIQNAIKSSPSSFNSQSSRAVILFGQSHENFWAIVLETLRKLVPNEAFVATQQKIQRKACSVD